MTANWKLIWIGVGIMLTGALGFFVGGESLDSVQIIGLAIVILVGLGLTVAGSPDQRKDDN